jgi:catechol-2,3-dioxygenase
LIAGSLGTSLACVKQLAQVSKEKNTDIERASGHGHAIGIYNRDPEGNGIGVSY